MADERSSEVPPPGFLFSGLRCALEMLLVGIAVGLVGLPARNPVYLGVVVVLAFAAMTVVLFWAIDRQMAEWIRRARGEPRMTDGGR